MLRKLIFAGALLCVAWLPAYAQNPIPPGNIPTTNGSATITAGNSFQTVLSSPAAKTRNSLTIQNNNTNGDNCWVFIGPNASATKATSILLGQGGSYQRYSPFVPSDNISATCTTTSDSIYVDTQ